MPGAASLSGCKNFSIPGQGTSSPSAPGLSSLCGMRVFLFVLICVQWIACASTAPAETVSVAAAADLVFCLEAMDASFEKAHPDIKIQVTTGSSGNFFAQIKNGAPFDLFLSADVGYPRQLAEGGFAEKDTLVTYAFGRLVLWAANPNLDLQRGLPLLSDPAVRKIAIANPDHAPYGRAAKAALEHEKLWDPLQPKIVLGENIAQAMQFAQSGNADVGLVALSLARSVRVAGKERYFEVPEDFYPRLEQTAIITKHGAANASAKVFLEYLRGAEGRKVLEEYGFKVP